MPQISMWAWVASTAVYGACAGWMYYNLLKVIKEKNKYKMMAFLAGAKENPVTVTLPNDLPVGHTIHIQRTNQGWVAYD